VLHYSKVSNITFSLCITTIYTAVHNLKGKKKIDTMIIMLFSHMIVSYKSHGTFYRKKILSLFFPKIIMVYLHVAQILSYSADKTIQYFRS
jgi:hypothetical protein